ncbi:hypothetical protein Nepgr_033322 [Nepenthes gracilis]|uniref:Protein DA1-like domain-containing protein n=1 Tax=Nepenthes gracilis TaxID=150966 RepID=A0AAD3TLP2_NEPGR|nr:hypothetical protein Nepgr_033322 [Nepenthes gracilis]
MVPWDTPYFRLDDGRKLCLEGLHSSIMDTNGDKKTRDDACMEIPNGYPNLSPEVEEGICQVLPHMWLDFELLAGSGSSCVASLSSSSLTLLPSSSLGSLTSTGSSKKGKWSQFERKLGKFFKHQIESDGSAAYGDGFRR